MQTILARSRRGAAAAAAALLAALMIAGGALAAPPNQAAQEEVELGLDEILANYYEVMGGLETLRSVESMRVTGILGLPQGMEASFVNTSVRPNLSRMELQIQGMTGVQAYDGETAWMFMPFMGQTAPEPMPADMAASVARQSDIEGPLVDYEEKGHEIEVVGMADVEGTEAIQLKVTFASGHEQHYYLDAEYFVPLKVVSMESMGGNEFEQVQMPSDFKEVDGMLVPHSVQIVGPQGTQTLTVESVEIGVEVDESIFAMPEPEEEEEGEGSTAGR